MYVLSSESAEPQYYPSPQAVPGGYAILSHAWDGNEQTFEDVQRISKKCKRKKKNPRDFVSEKIRQSCILAEKHGYRWIWNDTCCIDKRSSSELSEAINSMFRYHSLAKVCYAYLQDVPSGDILDGDDSAFRRSRWHKRGWTLQELIAPEFLIFVSADWHLLGARMDLSEILVEVTKIPARLLRRKTTVSDYSVARRMSWAAMRETTQEEDRAYSLMGLFGIHMLPLYGEGENAFRRLQEEIMKQSVDPSLFLWGFTFQLDQRMIETAPVACTHSLPFSYLLASSPSHFSTSSAIEYLPSRYIDVVRTQTEEPRSIESQAVITASPATFNPRHLPTFTLTPFGIHAHNLPVAHGPHGILLAILPCFEQGKPLGLLLYPCMQPFDPLRPLYHTAMPMPLARAFTFDDVQSLLVRVEAVAVEWKDVYITALQPPQTNSPLTPLTNNMFTPPFRILEASMRNLLQEGYVMHTPPLTLPTWTGIPHVSFVFLHLYSNKFMAILLGRCESHVDSGGPQTSESGRLGPHWAKVIFYPSERCTPGLDMVDEHACPSDHADAGSCIRVKDPHIPATSSDPPGGLVFWLLSFTPCLISPSTTLIVHVTCYKFPASQTTEIIASDISALHEVLPIQNVPAQPRSSVVLGGNAGMAARLDDGVTRGLASRDTLSD